MSYRRGPTKLAVSALLSKNPPIPYTVTRSRGGEALDVATTSMNIYQGGVSITFRSCIRFLFDFVLTFIKDPLHNAILIKNPADE